MKKKQVVRVVQLLITCHENEMRTKVTCLGHYHARSHELIVINNAIIRKATTLELWNMCMFYLMVIFKNQVLCHHKIKQNDSIFNKNENNCRQCNILQILCHCPF